MPLLSSTPTSGNRTHAPENKEAAGLPEGNSSDN